jgi:cytochrome c oxidase subunit IV
VAENKHDGAQAEGHHGIGRYAAVWILLLILTAVTVATGRMDMGAANIWVAMAIAVTKATLVVLFFMHLWDASSVNRMVFVVSVLFLVVLILGVFGDLLTRMPMTLPHGGPVPFSAGP